MIHLMFSLMCINLIDSMCEVLSSAISKITNKIACMLRRLSLNILFSSHGSLSL